MTENEPLKRGDINKRYKEFSGEIFSKQYFLDKRNINKFKTDNNAKFTNTIIAIYDMTSEDFDGKSVIIDLSKGIIITNKSAKTLINEFARDNEWMDFNLIRSIMKFNNMATGIPLVTGVDVYVPLGGSIGRSSDWVSLNWISKYRLKDKQARFTTNLNFDLEFKYYGKNLTKKIYNACFIGEQANSAIKQAIESMGYKISSKYERGILDEFIIDEMSRCSLTVKAIFNQYTELILMKLHSFSDLELDQRFKLENVKVWQRHTSYNKFLW